MRYKSERLVPTSFRFPPEVLRRLDRFAKTEGCTRVAAVRLLLDRQAADVTLGALDAKVELIRQKLRSMDDRIPGADPFQDPDPAPRETP